MYVKCRWCIGGCGISRWPGGVPVDNAERVQLLKDAEQGDCGLDTDAELRPGLSLPQEHVQQITTHAVLHHNVHLPPILESSIELGHPLHTVPAARRSPRSARSAETEISCSRNVTLVGGACPAISSGLILASNDDH